MTDSTTLAPCPFCGGAPKMVERPDNIDGTEFFCALACYCDGYSACAHQMANRKTAEQAKHDAIAAWNRRAPAPASQPVAVPAGMEPYGQITSHSKTGQQFFYRWPEPPYLDNASECVTVHTAAQVQAMLATAPSGPAREPIYRLLVRGVDTIQADDEFLREDGVTWRVDPHEVFVGMTYQGDALLPARRAITAAQKGGKHAE